MNEKKKIPSSEHNPGGMGLASKISLKFCMAFYAYYQIKSLIQFHTFHGEGLSEPKGWEYDFS